MAKMRAKMYVSLVQENYSWDDKTKKVSETLVMSAVAKSTSYEPDGLDEDNTYAKFSPGGQLTLTVANPALWNQFKFGEKYYLDFTEAPK